MTGIQISILNHQGYHSTKEGKEESSYAKEYRDKSTIMLVATRGMIPAKAYQCHQGLFKPMNQLFTSIVVINAEVGDAYEEGISVILNDESFKHHDWKYLLTLEEDNLPPPDGILRLHDAMAESEGRYAGISGLYWGKGEEGQPMCYGKPTDHPRNYTPFQPEQHTLTECNGIGMGFALFDMKVFRDPNFLRPFFRTVQERVEGGFRLMTQDIAFCSEAAKLGYRFAVDSRILVGHYDVKSDRVF